MLWSLQVCIPGLHLLLGIFNRLWTLLEDTCTQLDLRMAEANTGGSGVSGSTFQRYLQQRSSLRSQRDFQLAHVTLLEQLSTHLTLSLPQAESNETVHAVRSQAANARNKAEEMVWRNNSYTSFIPK